MHCRAVQLDGADIRRVWRMVEDGDVMPSKPCLKPCLCGICLVRGGIILLEHDGATTLLPQLLIVGKELRFKDLQSKYEFCHPVHKTVRTHLFLVLCSVHASTLPTRVFQNHKRTLAISGDAAPDHDMLVGLLVIWDGAVVVPLLAQLTGDPYHAGMSSKHNIALV
jgi:hypothetical protein